MRLRLTLYFIKRHCARWLTTQRRHSLRSAAASLGTTNQEGQSLQLQAQEEQKQLTEAIVASAKSGASVKDIARAVVPILGIPEESAIQGVQGIIAQAGAPQQQAPTPQAPGNKKP